MTGGTRHLDFGIELVKRGYKVYIISSDFNVHKLQHMKLSKDEYYKIENVSGVNLIVKKDIFRGSHNFDVRLLVSRFDQNSFATIPDTSEKRCG